MTERESMMDEYIDRQKLFDALPEVKEDKQISLYGAVADFMIIASSIPSADVVEVVRCKDCEYGREEDHNTYSCANFPDGIGGYISGECFCSYGERKEQK